ncbi:MAG: YdcF family protein [Ruminococcus sp.]|nr:YdcF family protein [Ruminococcus sp.]
MYLWILRIFAVIFLIWFIAPIFKNYFNHGNRLGIAICLYILLFYTNTPVFEYVKSFCHSSPALTTIWNISKWLIYAFVAYAVIVTLAMIIASLIKPKDKATAVLLGNRATKDGPSDLLYGRIMATKAYLDSSKDTVAVLSGGKTKKDYIAEAKCAYTALTKLGINSDRLIVEDKSKSTYENILFSYRIIEDLQKEKNLAIVSDSFHQLRARLIVRKLGIKAKVGAVNAQTSFLYIPTYFVREWIALPFELLFRFRPHRQ